MSNKVDVGMPRMSSALRLAGVRVDIVPDFDESVYGGPVVRHSARNTFTLTLYGVSDEMAGCLAREIRSKMEDVPMAKELEDAD